MTYTRINDWVFSDGSGKVIRPKRGWFGDVNADAVPLPVADYRKIAKEIGITIKPTDLAAQDRIVEIEGFLSEPEPEKARELYMYFLTPEMEVMKATGDIELFYRAADIAQYNGPYSLRVSYDLDDKTLHCLVTDKFGETRDVKITKESRNWMVDRAKAEVDITRQTLLKENPATAKLKPQELEMLIVDTMRTNMHGLFLPLVRFAFNHGGVEVGAEATRRLATLLGVLSPADLNIGRHVRAQLARKSERTLG